MKIKITSRTLKIDPYLLSLEESKKKDVELEISNLLKQLKEKSERTKIAIISIEEKNSALNLLIERDKQWAHEVAIYDQERYANIDEIQTLKRELKNAQDEAYKTPIGDSKRSLGNFLLITEHKLKEEDILIEQTDLTEDGAISETTKANLQKISQDSALINALNESLKKLHEANKACEKLILETKEDTEEYKLLKKIQCNLTDRNDSPKERLINTNKTLNQTLSDGPSSYARIIIEAIKEILNGRLFHFTLFKDKINNYKNEINKDVQNKP